MLSLTQINETHIFLINIVSLLLVASSVYSFARSMVSGYKWRAIIISISDFLIALFSYQVTALVVRINMGVIYQGFEWAGDIPLWVMILLLSLALILTCYLHNYLRYEKFNIISRKSIRDAIDNLPLGISIYTDSGILIFTNKVMNDIAYAIKEGDDVNPLEFLSALERLRIQGEKELIVPLNGEYYLFTSNKLTLKTGRLVNELIASNITEEYRINMTLKEESEQLSKYNEDLKRVHANIVKITAEEEVLNAKIKIHDKLGELLLVSRKADESTTLEDKSKIISMWSTTYKQLRNTGKEEGKTSFLSDLIKAANAIGVELEIRGEVPELPITNTMLHECLTNTIKHGNGSKMVVESILNDKHYTLTCRNNGKITKNVTFKGGLKSLQDLAIKQNGKLQVVESEGFAIQLILPRERVVR